MESRLPHEPAQHDLVLTADGTLTLRHGTHGELYHSHAGARAEAEALYMRSSGIECRLSSGGTAIAVLDVGLGLAYNALSTINRWLAEPRPPTLNLQSLEIDVPLIEATVGGNAPWLESWDAEVRSVLQHFQCNQTDQGSEWTARLVHPSGVIGVWKIYSGDFSRRQLPGPVDKPWDFVWHDPFSPPKNPALWSTDFFSRLRRNTSLSGYLMTYSVARAVRDNLGASGWVPERITTPWRTKRHWLRARPAVGKIGAIDE